MKKIKNLLLQVVFLLTLACTQGYAQNAIKHIDNAQNMALDYMIPSDEYLLSGNTFPATIGGMSNIGPTAGNLSRIQLEVLDNQMASVMFKTYCTVTEVNDVLNHRCTHLNAYFQTGDAKQTSDGGFIICGRVRVDNETSGCPGSAQYDHLFLLKVDAAGAVQWYKRYFDPAMQFGMLNSVIEASNGNFITCGYENYGSMTHAVILGVNSAGGLLWSDYAQAGAYWDHSIILPSIYYEITPYNGDYALVGIGNTAGTVWGNTILTVIDANGNYIAHNILDNQLSCNYVLTGRGIHDAYDNDVVLTGAGGTPCLSGSQIFILKIDPVTLAVNFLKIYSYNNFGDVSWGNSIVTWGSAGGNFSVAGRDATNNGALYLETDNNGNLLRYTPFNNADASVGKSIVWNSNSSWPVYSGEFWPATEPTFLVRNNYGNDCPSDIPMVEYTTCLDDYDCPHIPAPFQEVTDDAIDYDINPIESIVCGQLKPASVSKITAVENILITPNPSDGLIDVNLGNAKPGNCTLQVYDMTGRIVLSQKSVYAGKAIRLNISALPSGTYMLSAGDKDGKTERAGFIKN